MNAPVAERDKLKQLNEYLAELRGAEDLEDFYAKQEIDPSGIGRLEHEELLELLLEDRDEHLQIRARAELLAFYKRQYWPGARHIYLSKYGPEGALIRHYLSLAEPARQRVVEDACALASSDYRDYEFRVGGRTSPAIYYPYNKDFIRRWEEAAIIEMLSPAKLQSLMLSVLGEHFLLCSLLHTFIAEEPEGVGHYVPAKRIIDAIVAEIGAGKEEITLSADDSLRVAAHIEPSIAKDWAGLSRRLCGCSMGREDIKALIERVLAGEMAPSALFPSIGPLVDKGLGSYDGACLALTIKGLVYIVARLPTRAFNPAPKEDCSLAEQVLRPLLQGL